MAEANDYDPLSLAAAEKSRVMRQKYRATIVGTLGERAAQRFDREMRNVDLGISHAVGIWRGMSVAQRMVALRMLTVRCLMPRGNQFVTMSKSGKAGAVVGSSTVGALYTRGIIFFDEKKAARLSEKGRFVLRFRRG